MQTNAMNLFLSTSCNYVASRVREQLNINYYYLQVGIACASSLRLIGFMLCHSGLRGPPWGESRACACIKSSKSLHTCFHECYFSLRAICALLGGKPGSEFQRKSCQVTTVSLQKRSDVSRDCISFFREEALNAATPMIQMGSWCPQAKDASPWDRAAELPRVRPHSSEHSSDDRVAALILGLIVCDVSPSAAPIWPRGTPNAAAWC